MKGIVAPSILSCDFMNIETELNAFKGIEDLWLHLDVMDGHFVPNLTFGPPIIKMISKITDITLDAHLMVSNPEFHVEALKDHGVHNLTFHLEATQDVIGLVNEAKKHYPSVGISIKPKTEVSQISDELLLACDLILVMSVEPGFGGQKFMENAYDKIAELVKRRDELGTSFSIQVDGGVSDDNATKLRVAGADNLVAGSFVFKNGPSEYSNQIDKIR